MTVIGSTALNWGFTAQDVLSNSVTLFGTLAAFVLLGLAIAFAPRLISLVRMAIVGRGTRG